MMLQATHDAKLWLDEEVFRRSCCSYNFLNILNDIKYVEAYLFMGVHCKTNLSS